MEREDFREWSTLPLTLEVFGLLKARRKELMECVVTADVPEQELFRIRGIIRCMDELMSGDLVEDQGD